MQAVFRKLFFPILNYFEAGSEPYIYKSSHRTILLAIGCLFSGLATAVFFVAKGQDTGYLLPVIIFGLVGMVSLVVGLFGNERAVAKIWGSR